MAKATSTGRTRAVRADKQATANMIAPNAPPVTPAREIQGYAGDPNVMASLARGSGSRLPASCTSMGRVLLAGLTDAELDVYLSRVKLVKLTTRTVSTADELKVALNAVRRNGYAVVDQELEIGLRSIAVPVSNRDGRSMAAINVGTQSSRVSVAEMESKFLPPLRAAAHELGLLLAR